WMDPVYPKNLVSFDFRQFSKSCDACPPPAILGHENLETLPSVGARIPRIRLAGDPLCSDLCLGLLPTASLIGMWDCSHCWCTAIPLGRDGRTLAWKSGRRTYLMPRNQRRRSE